MGHRIAELALALASDRLMLDEMGIVDFGATPLLVWVNGDDDERTVNGTVNVDLDRLRAISIRDTRINMGVGPTAVVACGLIVDDDNDSDSDSD